MFLFVRHILTWWQTCVWLLEERHRTKCDKIFWHVKSSCRYFYNQFTSQEKKEVRA